LPEISSANRFLTKPYPVLTFANFMIPDLFFPARISHGRQGPAGIREPRTQIAMSLNEKGWRWKMAFPSKTVKVNAKGILLPSEWDENGAIIALSLFTHDEDEYRVESNEMSMKLQDYLREELLVEGVLRWEQGRKIIQIKGFSRFENL
jgi:hypothetical protein